MTSHLSPEHDAAREQDDETLLDLASDRPIDPMVFSEVQRRGLVGLLDRMAREGHTAREMLEIHAREAQAAAEARAEHEQRITEECGVLRVRLEAEWQGERASIDFSTVSARLEHASRLYRARWVGVHGTREQMLRQRLADETLRVRGEQYDEVAERMISAFPYALERYRAAYRGNLSANHTTMDGRIHLVVVEPFRIGRLVREAGQALDGRRSRDFYELEPVVAGARQDRIAAGDLRVLERLLQKLAAPVPPPPRVRRTR
jgi:hypothetical protein